MNLKDIFSAFKIRKLYRNSSVKTSGSCKSRIKRFRSVGSSKNHNTVVTFKSVHLCKELIESLLSFIIAI